MPRIEMTELERKKLADAGRQSIACTHGWRPIETAPKDGTMILAWMSGGAESRPHYSLIHWFDFGWGGSWTITLPGLGSDPGYEDSAFTHWQPLPKPPQEESK